MTQAETTLLAIYVAIVRLEARPALSALVRNPWFTFTQAPFAARRARRLIKRLRADYERDGLHGLLGIVDLCEGRMLAHQGRRAEAQCCVDHIHGRLADAGIDDLPAPVAALVAELQC